MQIHCGKVKRLWVCPALLLLPAARRNWHFPKPPLESQQWINTTLAKVKLLIMFIPLKHVSLLARTSDIKSKANHCPTVRITQMEVLGALDVSLCVLQKADVWTREVHPCLTSQRHEGVATLPDPSVMLSTAALAVKSLQRAAVHSGRVKCLLSDSGLPDLFLLTPPEVALETTGKGAIKQKCNKELITAPVQVGYQRELTATFQVGHQRLPLSSLGLVKTRVILLSFDSVSPGSFHP